MKNTETQVQMLPTTSHQLALDLFAALQPTGAPISESPHDIGFQRNNIFVDITDLGVAARRALDAIYFIVSQDPEIQRNYDVDLCFFKWLMTYPSDNRAHLRGILRELQRAAIQVRTLDHANPDDDRYGAIPLLGPFAIASGRLMFEVYEVLQRNIKDPRASHFFSLCCHAFTLVYARVVYDHILPLVSQGCTDWLDVAEARAWQGATAKSNEEFRYYKRDMLDPAIKQINEITHLDVRYETRSAPGSKKIAKIRFLFQQKREPKALQSALLGQQKLYTVLRDEFGLSAQNFDEIMVNRADWTDERIHDAMEFTRFNIERGKVTRSASGFLMMALHKNLCVSHSDRLIADQQAEKEAKAKQSADLAQARELTRRADQARQQQAEKEARQANLVWYADLPEAEKKAYLTEFSRGPMVRSTARRAKLITNPLTDEDIRNNEMLLELFGAFLSKKRKNWTIR